LPSRQPNPIHKAAHLKVRHHRVQAAELEGKKAVLAKHRTTVKVRTREDLNKAFKAEMSNAASGNSPPAKTSGDRLKASGSAKTKAKPNEGKTGRNRKVGNETRNVSRANANSGTNNSRANANSGTNNSGANENLINNSRVSVNRAVINSGVNVRANGTSSSKANVKVNATSSSRANGMVSRAAKLAPRH
jgi:hypothetical protein